MPSPQNKIPATTLKKIQTLVQIAHDLHAGKNFMITRLTSIKSLCNTPEIASDFVFHLAKCIQKEMEASVDKNMLPEKWMQHKKLVAEAVLAIKRFLAKKGTAEREELRENLQGLKSLQNTYVNQQWGPVRIVECTKTLLVEKAVECVLEPEFSSQWAYQVAREYAERYNPRYGTGLLPESAPMMENIARYWVELYGLNIALLEHRS